MYLVLNLHLLQNSASMAMPNVYSLLSSCSLWLKASASHVQYLGPITFWSFYQIVPPILKGLASPLRLKGMAH